MTISRIHTNKRLSQIVRSGDIVYLSGQVPEAGATDVATQTRQVLDKIDRLLAEAGSDKTQLVSVTIYLSDIKYFSAMNDAWEAWMPEGYAPARATIEAKLANPHYLVEIQVTAAVPGRKQSVYACVCTD